MPIDFSPQNVQQLDSEFAQFTEVRRAKIDALASMIFVNLHMVGLAHPSLPNTVPELQHVEIAKLRLLATTLEAVFGMTSLYGR